MLMVFRHEGLETKAELAREYFALYGPSDAPPLPLTYDERESLKVGGLSTLFAVFARSLEHQKYNIEKHPSFVDYARGVMASDHNGYADLKQDAALRRRYPPRLLAGMGPGLYWESPKEYAQTMRIYNRSRARAA